MHRSDLRSAPEPALVALAASGGDRRAFAELVRRRERWLRSLLRRLCGNPHEADDLAQETFLRAWRRIGKLRDPHAFGSWLRRLAVHLFIDTRRVHRDDAAEDLTSLQELAATAAPPERAIAAQLDLERTLALLSPAERACIVLNLGEGLTHAEIEQATGMPLGTVKSHILRGTAKLRQTTGAEHG